MLRHLVTPLGIALVVAGFSVLTSPHLVALLLLGFGAVLAAALVIAAIWRRGSSPPVGLTHPEEVSHWQRFAARRRRSAPWESAFYVAIAGAIIWLDGLNLGTILVAAGFGILVLSRWFVEPGIWAELTRRLADG
jgi:hypothetical protein